MKYPITSYEKLFNSMLLNEYPEIESIRVKNPSFFSFNKGVIVNVYLKDYDYEKYGIVPCVEFGKDILLKIRELVKYFGENSVPWINMYHNEKKICVIMTFLLERSSYSSADPDSLRSLSIPPPPFFELIYLSNMKYLIAESRLDELVQNYITNYVGLLERHSSPTFRQVYIWYTNLNDEMMFEINDNELGVFESMWNSVKRVFSLSDYDTDKAFLTWMKNNKQMKDFIGLYTFEYSG